MIVQVNNLTKRYGHLIAVDDISFSLNKGDIVGFLGPNGAGKSTTMRIITGCLAADSGKVTIGSYDIIENPKQAKRLIGYLPEHPPLYDEMTVDAYLDYVADLKDIPRSKKKRLKDMAVQECGLENVYRRIIKHLSKGYRQRVGIAQAIINDPDILILDEPTIGLDPGQVREIRELIKGLTGRRTVILSTHIIHEVAMICQKVIIINAGRIAASGSLDSLTSSVDNKAVIFFKIKGDHAHMFQMLSSINGVKNVQKKDSSYLIEHQADKMVSVCEEISRIVRENHLTVLELKPVRMTLEDIFVRIVSKDRK